MLTLSGYRNVARKAEPTNIGGEVAISRRMPRDFRMTPERFPHHGTVTAEGGAGGTKKAQVRSRFARSQNQVASLRILIVEDDALIAAVLGELLTAMGHKVCDTSATEIDAVAAAGRLKPDLMIVDGALRQGSGISAVEEITRSGPMPHFFLSGNSGRISAARPDSIVLRKPFRLAELSRAIDSAMVTHGVVPTLAGPSLKQSCLAV